jgi:hypothetical protein
MHVWSFAPSAGKQRRAQVIRDFANCVEGTPDSE